MNKLRVIDLLNKIANGEQPKTIKYHDTIYNFEEYGGDWGYVNKENRNYKWFAKEIDCDLPNYLNDEIEIIEEDKKDKEIEIYINGEKVDITDIYEPLKQSEYFYKENGKWYVHRLKNVTFEVEEDKKIEKLNIELNSLDDNKVNCYRANNLECDLAFKINEIIDKLNKEE